MLNRTKRYNEMLKRAGLKRKDYRVNTPYDNKRRGWGETEITILNEKAITEDIVKRLLEEGLQVKKVVFKEGEENKEFFIVKPYRPQVDDKQYEEMTIQ